MNSREIKTNLEDSRAVLTFSNPPVEMSKDSDAHRARDVRQIPLDKIQRQLHPGVPARNFVKPFAVDSGATIKKVGHTMFDSAFASMSHYAFSEHLPVELRPDDIHLLILQGITRFIQQYPEDFRNIVVPFDGKKELEVRDDLLSDISQKRWEEIPKKFVEKLKQNASSELVNLLLQDYSQTTEMDKQVKAVTLMGTFSAYFNYNVSTRCFIPQFILQGSEQDWKLLAELPKKIIDLLHLQQASSEDQRKGPNHLYRWLERLQPILQEMYRSRCGSPDSSFWESFYKFNSSSGLKIVSGNIVYFYPFLSQHDEYHHVIPGKFELNPYIMEKEIELGKEAEYLGSKVFAGPDTLFLPANIVEVDFKWKLPLLNKQYDMGMLAGMVAFNANKEKVNTYTDYSIFYKPGTKFPNNANSNSSAAKFEDKLFSIDQNYWCKDYSLNRDEEDVMYHFSGAADGCNELTGKEIIDSFDKHIDWIVKENEKEGKVDRYAHIVNRFQKIRDNLPELVNSLIQKGCMFEGITNEKITNPVNIR